MRLRGVWKAGVCMALLLAAGCERAPAPAAPASEPAAAVQRLARHLHDNDLAGFARDAVPPGEYARLESAWREGRSRWPLTELPLQDQLQPMLAALAAPDSERSLQQGFNRNFAHQDKDLKDAARSLGLFGVKYVKREGIYTPEERAHYAQVIGALSEWAAAAPLADPVRGRKAIPDLAAAARRTGLATEAQIQAAGMQGTLRRLAPFFAQAKTTLASYGLPLDRSFSGLRAELVEQKGELARVRVRYPLGRRQIDTVISLQRRDGHWYLADHLRHAAQALAPPEQEQVVAPAAPPAG